MRTVPASQRQRLVQPLGTDAVVFADRLAARRQRLEAARAKRRAIRAGAARDLALFEHYGVVRQVRIDAAAASCESCAALAARSFSFEQARGVLPNRECRSERGWCDCTWAAERRLSPR